MTYGRLEDSFRRNPKVVRLARTLGVRRAEARGLLTGLWSQLLTQAPDGDVGDFEPSEIEEFADWEGAPGELIRALEDERHRFLDRRRGRLFVHDWGFHAEGLKRAAWKRAERLKKKDLSRDKGATVAPEEIGEDRIRFDQKGEEREESASRDIAPAAAPERTDLVEVVADIWDASSRESPLPRVARPLTSRFLKDFYDRTSADAQRVRLEWWEGTVRRAHAARFLWKKKPPTTFGWLLGNEERLQRLLAGDFDRDYSADDAEARSKTPTSPAPASTSRPAARSEAKPRTVPATPAQPSEEPELLKRLKKLTGATSPAAAESKET